MKMIRLLLSLLPIIKATVSLEGLGGSISYPAYKALFYFYFVALIYFDKNKKNFVINIFFIGDWNVDN